MATKTKIITQKVYALTSYFSIAGIQFELENETPCFCCIRHHRIVTPRQTLTLSVFLRAGVRWPVEPRQNDKELQDSSYPQRTGNTDFAVGQQTAHTSAEKE